VLRAERAPDGDLTPTGRLAFRLSGGAGRSTAAFSLHQWAFLGCSGWDKSWYDPRLSEHPGQGARAGGLES